MSTPMTRIKKSANVYTLWVASSTLPLLVWVLLIKWCVWVGFVAGCETLLLSPLVRLHHPPLRKLRCPSQLFWCMFCSGSSLRFSTQSENCSSDLGHSLLFLPSSQGVQPSIISLFSSSLSPDFRLCTPISEVNIPFKTTQAGLRVYWVAEVNKLENVHSDSGKRVPETPCPTHPNPFLWVAN